MTRKLSSTLLAYLVLILTLLSRTRSFFFSAGRDLEDLFNSDPTVVLSNALARVWSPLVPVPQQSNQTQLSPVILDRDLFPDGFTSLKLSPLEPNATTAVLNRFKWPSPMSTALSIAQFRERRMWYNETEDLAFIDRENTTMMMYFPDLSQDLYHQITSLYSAVAFSVVLNRTFVMPYFRGNPNDTQVRQEAEETGVKRGEERARGKRRR